MTEPPSTEIRISDVLTVLGEHKRALYLAPLVLLACAILYLHFAEPRYSVTLKVTPTASTASTLPPGISGLADLAGLAIPAPNESIDFELYLEGLQSRETSAAVAANEELLRQLFPEEWSDADRDWVQPSGFFAGLAGVVKTVFGIPDPGWQPPNAERVNEFLDEEMRIVRDRSGPVVTITIEHHQPRVAQALLGVLHQVVDSALRQKELDRTSAYVAYLREQLSNVAVTEYRQALHDILAEQEKRRMVASSNLPFAAEPFGQPTISVRPTAPRPYMLLFSSLLFGGLLGIIAALALHQLGRRPRRQG